jgi:hypothetical protein
MWFLKNVTVVCGMTVILFKMPCAELNQLICQKMLGTLFIIDASLSRKKLVFSEYLKSLADFSFCYSHLIQMHAMFTGSMWLLVFHLLFCSLTGCNYAYV